MIGESWAAALRGTHPLTRRQAAWDLLLAVLCSAVAVAAQLTEIDAITANRAPDVYSVLLTVAAVLPLALRRRAPLAVLIACFPGVLGLIAARYSVGVAPLGAIISFYSAVAWDSRRNARRAVIVLAVGLAAVVVLRPIDLSLEGLLVNAALFVGGLVMGTGTRERREHHAAQVATAQLQVLVERQRADLAHDRATHAATKERLRISRELHDVLGHAFSVMVVQAGVAEHLLDTAPEESRRALGEISATGRTSLAELRGMLRVFRDDDDAPDPARNPSPTLNDVPALIARVRAAGLAVDLRPGAPAARFAPGVELAAYRVIQEALTNSLRHSGAGRAWVRLDADERSLRIEIGDDGHSLDEPARLRAEQEGQGLTGMRERVAIYGGEFCAGPGPDGGYLVRATLPSVSDQPSGEQTDQMVGASGHLVEQTSLVDAVRPDPSDPGKPLDPDQPEQPEQPDRPEQPATRPAGADL
jgi:signal transduction histidine kinase